MKFERKERRAHLRSRDARSFRKDELRKGIYGAPGVIRTPDLLVRSQLLYPAELRAHIASNATFLR